MPSIAVIATWILTAIWMMILGSPAAALTFRRFGVFTAARIALWHGLAAVLLLLLITNFVTPLRNTHAVVVALLAAVAAAVIAVTITITRQSQETASAFAKRGPFPFWSLVLVGTLALSLIPVAHAAFGAANQWDTGLYHLNAIQYASEYRVIPGLANLHDRFGVTNSQHLLTALLSNSGWGVDAFRLQVGFFVFLFAADISLRLIDNRKASLSVGTLIVLLSAFGAIPFLLSNPDELITSPSPDSIALLLTLVGTAYLADGIVIRRTELAATGTVVLATAASVRTQLWAFALLAAVVVLVSFRRGKSGVHRPRVLTLVASALSGGLLIVTQIRDSVQSGWVLFPLDLFPLPVDWKAFDPASSRIWIISWARTPGASPDETIGTWSWVAGWLTRSASDWGIRLMLGLLALATTLWLLRTVQRRSPEVGSSSPSRALWLVIPVSTAIALWFLSAPDPRFAWGQIVLLGAIPAAVAVASRLSGTAIPLTAAVAALTITPAAIAALVGINGTTSEDQTLVTFSQAPWTISAAITPVPSPDLMIYTLPSGEDLITPTADDRCWTAFPLCRPYPNDSLVFRGDSIQDGFASRLWDQ